MWDTVVESRTKSLVTLSQGPLLMVVQVWLKSKILPKPALYGYGWNFGDLPEAIDYRDEWGERESEKPGLVVRHDIYIFMDQSHEILTGTITPSQTVHVTNGNEVVFPELQNWNHITGCMVLFIHPPPKKTEKYIDWRVFFRGKIR